MDGGHVRSPMPGKLLAERLERERIALSREKRRNSDWGAHERGKKKSEKGKKNRERA